MSIAMATIETAHKLYVWRAEIMLTYPQLRDEARATEAKCVALQNDPPALLAAYAAQRSRYSELDATGMFDHWYSDDMHDEQGLARGLFADSQGMPRLDAACEDAWLLISEDERAEFVALAATMIGGAH